MVTYKTGKWADVDDFFETSQSLDGQTEERGYSRFSCLGKSNLS